MATNNTIDELLSLLEVSIRYEQERKNLGAYISKANSVLGTRYQECTSCSSLMKRYHNDFQKAVWTRIRDNYPEYLPTLPKLNSAKFLTDYWVKTLPILSFDDLRATEQSCRTEAVKFRAKKNVIDEQRFLDDFRALGDYRQSKVNYFTDFLPEMLATKQVVSVEDVAVSVVEDQPTNYAVGQIDKTELVRLKDKGESNVYCAKYFDVSPSAIGKMLKSLNYGTTNSN